MEKKAFLRQIPFKKQCHHQFPITILDIFENQKIITPNILDENYVNFRNIHQFQKGFFDNIEFDKESKLCYKVKMFEYKDFGEDICEIYHT